MDLNKIPMKQVDRIILIMALILVMVALIVVFVASRGGIKKFVTSPKTAVTLVFTQWWQDELEADTLAVLIREFEKRNPRIHIRLDSRTYLEIQNKALKMALAVVANKTRASSEYQNPFPRTDVLALDPRWLHELIQHEVLEPLTSYSDQADFTPALYLARPDAQYEAWAMPLVSFMAPLFYNIEVLQAAGFDRPPKNQTDFLRYARTITVPGTDRFGMVLSLDPEHPEDVYHEVYSWIWASGAIMMRDGAPSFTGRPLIETLDFLGTLRQEGLLSPGSFAKTREQKLEEFCTGKAGMMIASVQDIDFLRKRIGDTGFGITTIPGPEGYLGKPVFGLTGWYAGISRYSEHKAEAWTFISFLAESIAAPAAKAHAVLGSGTIPPDYLRDNPLYAKVYDMYEEGDTIQEFTGVPQVRELETIAREELYELLEAGRDAPATAETIQQRWEDVLVGG
ncbi:MAG: extracellular solute-binding protein [Treponema sp.]|jgi:multiple sugar transport system substrate-binding protein|nr:extracellular solute-binding protein [Treponema sp.]